MQWDCYNEKELDEFGLAADAAVAAAVAVEYFYIGSENSSDGNSSIAELIEKRPERVISGYQQMQQDALANGMMQQMQKPVRKPVRHEENEQERKQQKIEREAEQVRLAAARLEKEKQERLKRLTCALRGEQKKGKKKRRKMKKHSRAHGKEFSSDNTGDGPSRFVVRVLAKDEQGDFVDIQEEGDKAMDMLSETTRKYVENAVEDRRKDAEKERERLQKEAEKSKKRKQELAELQKRIKQIKEEEASQGREEKEAENEPSKRSKKNRKGEGAKARARCTGNLPSWAREGDWICATCDFLNYASREICGRCEGEEWKEEKVLREHVVLAPVAPRSRHR